MNQGYVKLWRKSMGGGWLTNPKLWTFWCWCLMKASHKEYDLMVGCQKVHLMPGDFIFGLNKASEELEMSVRSIRTVFDFLKKSKNATSKTTNKFSVVSIVNWDVYQSNEIENDKQNDKPPTSHRQATDNKQTHKNVKNKTYTDEFLSFWSAYPKKIGKDAAWKAWNGRNEDRPEIRFILDALNQQKSSEQWTRNHGQYIPYPSKWLNQGWWANEVEIKKQQETW